MVCQVEQEVASINAYTIARKSSTIWNITSGIPADRNGLRLSVGQRRAWIPLDRDTFVTAEGRGNLFLYRGNIKGHLVPNSPGIRIGAVKKEPSGTLVLVDVKPDVTWLRDWKPHITKTTPWAGVKPSNYCVASVGENTSHLKQQLLWLPKDAHVLCMDTAGVVAEIVGAGGYAPPIIKRADRARVLDYLQEFQRSLPRYALSAHSYCRRVIKELKEQAL